MFNDHIPTSCFTTVFDSTRTLENKPSPSSSLTFNFYPLPFADVCYDYVIDQQPIGRILFRLFCENKRPLYYRYIAFLDNVTRYD